MRPILTLLVMACAVAGEDPAVGYRRQGFWFQGPGEWHQSVEPIWVFEYHRLRLQYRASGLVKTDDVILTLRPGSVGPVTPKADNPENPFVAGAPVAVVKAMDLVSDAAAHTVEIELSGKTRTAQVDQLIFSLPSGAWLSIKDLQFLGEPDVFPCSAGGPVLPRNAERLFSRGPSTCSGLPATSLRGRESIHIAGREGKWRTLYLSLMSYFAGVSPLSGVVPFVAGQPSDRWRVKESSETADVIARVNYADGSQEDQFPLLVSEGRHTLLNRRAALYAITLNFSQGIRSVELMDRSPHVQLVLFAAGLSQDAAAKASDEPTPPPFPATDRSVVEPSLEGSPWYRITASPDEVRSDFRNTQEAGRRVLSLVLTNISQVAQEFTLDFPSVIVRPASDPNDVYYLFPQQGAVIARDERLLEAAYSNRFPLQFMDVFAPGSNSGVCVIIRDTNGGGKKFRLKKNGTAVVAEVEYPIRLAPGETLRVPDAQLVTHGGDWHEGFEAYRNWVKSWYKPVGPRPAWLRSAFWARRDYPVGGSGQLFDEQRNRYTFGELIHDGEAFGGIDFIDISGWSLSDSVGRVGDYVIELGGQEDLRRNIGNAEGAGISTGLYFAGYHIDRNSAISRRFGSTWQLIDRKGQKRWWPGEVELWVCPHIPAWRQYLGGRMAAVAKEVGAAAVYLDVFGVASDAEKCYSTAHGHVAGVDPLPGEIAMAKEVRRNLDAVGMKNTITYLEYNPPDAAAPFFDAAFCYALPFSDRTLSPVKLNLWRFAFPDVRLWDMLSIGINPRVLSAEDFRLSLWHGNGLWLKGDSYTWYGEDLLPFIRRAHGLLKQHAAAFAGMADPLIESPHPAVFINRFRGGGQTVYTLFNSAYRTVRFRFQGQERSLGPRDVDVIASN